MAERPVQLDHNVCAIYDDEARKVYFQHVTLNGMEGCRPPRDYVPPMGYTVIEAPKIWSSAPSRWVV